MKALTVCYVCARDFTLHDKTEDRSVIEKISAIGKLESIVYKWQIYQNLSPENLTLILNSYETTYWKLQ